MPFISKKLYSKIPLYYRLEAFTIKKLIKIAWKEYGIVYNTVNHSSKYDIIDDIVYSRKWFCKRVSQKYNPYNVEE